MSNPVIDEFVQKAYYQAEDTLLWSETGGCKESCSNNEGYWTDCDRSFEDHGWTTDEVIHSSELHEAIHTFVSRYWTEIQWMGMTPEEFGHNFILNINGHGAGFWSLNYERSIMTAMAQDCSSHLEFAIEEYADGLHIIVEG